MTIHIPLMKFDVRVCAGRRICDGIHSVPLVGKGKEDEDGKERRNKN